MSKSQFKVAEKLETLLEFTFVGISQFCAFEFVTPIAKNPDTKIVKNNLVNLLFIILFFIIKYLF